MNSKNNLFFTKKRAFTLVELLIVIAIIGILFIVLITKVDFATNKSKASGVQTDFRSFQVAIESVAKEHAGLATFGWDTGDTNGDRIRNSYDAGDVNENGVQDEGEIFVGSKVYGEEWTNIYTLTNPADANDKSAIIALEEAINKNLDPKLHITINDDLTITMANGAQDPWNTEYHGYYITNAEVDGKDRGAIIIYSNGANQEFGSDHSIAGGVVVVNVPGNNKIGKDDYGVSVVYTYVNGYGEVKTSTTGFSTNQEAPSNSNNSNNGGNGGDLNNVPVIGETRQFATLISSATLKDIYDLSTSTDKEYGYASLVYNDNTYLCIDYFDGVYDIYYEFYNESEDWWYCFYYATEGIVNLGYAPEVGWYTYDDYGDLVPCNAPYITFVQDLIIDMPNGLSDIAPLFVGGSGGGNLSDNVERHESGLPYDVVFIMEDSTDYCDGLGLLFSEDGTMDLLTPYWAHEGDGVAMVSMKTLFNVQPQSPAPKATNSKSNSNVTTLVAPSSPDYSNDLFEYTLYDDGYFEGYVSCDGNDFELVGQYDKETDCLYVNIPSYVWGTDSDITVVSEYYQKIESIRYDQTYYRAGEKNDYDPNTLLFKKDGSFYIDDVLQDYTMSAESTAQFGFIMVEEPLPCSVPLVSSSETELVIYFASLDGTYITDGYNDYYLEDYSYEHVHDPERMIGSSWAHSYIPCCDIYIYEHDMQTIIAKHPNLSHIEGNTKMVCSCGYSYVSDYKSLEDYSWSEIQEIASIGLGSSYLNDIYGIKVGDRKNWNRLLDVQNIYGGWVFEGSFGLYDKTMNANDNIVGGYTGTSLAAEIESYYDTLEDQELKAVIEFVNVRCLDTLNNFTLVEGSYHLFLPSEIELGSKKFVGTTYYTYLLSEGVEPFEYYSSSPRSSSTWTRSMDPESVNAKFLSVLNSYTSGVSTDVTTTRYASPVFVIGKKSTCMDHTFTNTQSSKYLKCNANCLLPKTYYKSCSNCGYMSLTETFTVDSTLNFSVHFGRPINTGTKEVHTTYDCCGVIASTQHNLTETITSAATCLTNGSKNVVCKCGYTDTLVIDALGHSGTVVFAGTADAHEKYSGCECIYSTAHSYTSTITERIDGINIEGLTKRVCECGYKEAITPKSVDDYTWNELKILSQKKLNATTLESVYGIKVGDSKVYDNIEYVLVDADGNAYDGLVFMFKTGIRDQMNSSGINTGTYFASEAKQTVDQYYASMNSELKSAMKTVQVTCVSGYPPSVTKTTQETALFIPGAVEVGQEKYYNDTSKYELEGEMFDYFIKKSNTAEANALRARFGNGWWTRTAAYHDVKLFSYSFQGQICNTLANDQFVDIVACFVIG